MRTIQHKIVASGLSKTDFQKSLSQIRDDVGSRISGRNQEEKENWVIKRYFLLLSQAEDILAYPIKVLKRESPDYHVTLENEDYGIEVTESTSEYFQALLMESARCPELVHEPDKIRYGQTYTHQELLRMLRPPDAPLTGPGWMGLQAERDAASWARDAVEKKLSKIRLWRQEQAQETRLLLYDNCPAWIHDYPAFSRMLLKNIQELLTQKQFSPDIQIDFLSSSGDSLLYDILGANRLLLTLSDVPKFGDE